MNCKKIAVIKFSNEEVEEFKNIIKNHDLDSAIKILAKIDKKIADFTEPH